MYPHLPSPVNFREDINGLRAWAVIAVLLFHFSLIGLPGGFAGVDIFFVISGYLMTAIIVGGYEKGNFSIWKFYMSRARRILPALMLVITALLVLGWFFLPTVEFQELGKQSAYSLAFLSNIGYWKSSGYFDSAAHEKWLLHTWSLAVEAQFYLLYPIFIALVWRFWKTLKALTIAVLLMFLASLALNLLLSQWEPSAAFYLLPTRGWELAAGALVYLVAKQYTLPKKPLNSLYWIGWLMILASFFFIDKTLSWPSYWAILPVLGTSLVILTNKQGCRFTNNIIAQWLGDRSYSIYLWHWPLVVGLYFASLQNEWMWVLSLFALSILLGHLSYRFIEIPTRKYLSQTNLRKEVILISFIGTVIGIAAVSANRFVFEGRLSEKAEQVAMEALNFGPHRYDCMYIGKKEYEGCRFGNGKPLGAILLGDSHAASSLNPILINATKHNKSVLYWNYSWCPTIDGLSFLTPENKERKCKEFNLLFKENLKNEGSAPLIIVNTSLYFLDHKIEEMSLNEDSHPANFSEIVDSMVNTICSFKKDREVFLVRPYPYMKNSVPAIMSRNISFGVSKEIKIEKNNYILNSKNLWEIQDSAQRKCGVKILNPLPYLCDEQYCYGSKDGRPLYYDDDHLSEYGNKFLLPMFEEVFKDD